jgi:hypothetical protein
MSLFAGSHRRYPHLLVRETYCSRHAKCSERDLRERERERRTAADMLHTPLVWAPQLNGNNLRAPACSLLPPSFFSFLSFLFFFFFPRSSSSSIFHHLFERCVFVLASQYLVYSYAASCLRHTASTTLVSRLGLWEQTPPMSSHKNPHAQTSTRHWTPLAA